MFENILQIVISDINTLIGIGTVIAAFVALAGLIFTLRQNRDSRYLEFVSTIDKELSTHLEKEKDLSGREDCLIYAYNYIHICDRVMFLIERKKIHKDFFEYYRDFFNYAITVLWWYTSVYPEDKHSLKLSWPTLTRWIRDSKKGIPYPIAHLPTEMVELLSEKNVNDEALLSEMTKRIQSV